MIHVAEMQNRHSAKDFVWFITTVLGVVTDTLHPKGAMPPTRAMQDP
jgi:hypothetical protein